MHNWSVCTAHGAKFNVLCGNLTAHLTSQFGRRVKSWISLRVKSWISLRVKS